MNGEERTVVVDVIFYNVSLISSRTTCVKVFAINFPTIYTTINFLHLIRYISQGEIIISCDMEAADCCEAVESRECDATIYCN
jgi:hypothetical protein